MFKPSSCLLVSVIALVRAVSTSDAAFDFYQSRGPYPTVQINISDMGDQAWFPNRLFAEKLSVYVFVVGTNCHPGQYDTLSHVASHGFLAVGVANTIKIPIYDKQSCTSTHVEVIMDIFNDDAKLPLELRGRVNGTRVVMGGHSGGVPCAFIAAGHRRSVVRGSISQHGAAVPVYNRLDDHQVKALPGAAMVLCGANDTEPFCGCSHARDDFYQRFDYKLPRVFITVAGATHNGGAKGASGDHYEGGYVVAYLYSLLGHDLASVDAAKALISGVAPRGNSYEMAEWPPPLLTEVLV